MTMNRVNWSVAALATVLGFFLVSFNGRLSSLNDKLSDVFEENEEHHSIYVSRSLTGDDIKDLKKKVKKNTKNIDKNKRVIRNISNNPVLVSSMVCPPGSLLQEHYGTTSSDDYCDSGANDMVDGAECVTAFMIADGKKIKCDDVVADSGTSSANLVDACCTANPECSDGSKAVPHYGSTSSDSYCNSGTGKHPYGSVCTEAFLMTTGKNIDCDDIYDVSSRTDMVLTCCEEPPQVCPKGSTFHILDGDVDDSTTPATLCQSKGDSLCLYVANSGAIDACFDTVPSGVWDAEVCCGGDLSLCIDSMPFVHGGSTSPDFNCGYDGNTCFKGFKISDMSEIDCDEIIDVTGEAYVQSCCF